MSDYSEWLEKHVFLQIFTISQWCWPFGYIISSYPTRHLSFNLTYLAWILELCPKTYLVRSRCPNWFVLESFKFEEFLQAALLISSLQERADRCLYGKIQDFHCQWPLHLNWVAHMVKKELEPQCTKILQCLFVTKLEKQGQSLQHVKPAIYSPQAGGCNTE